MNSTELLSKVKIASPCPARWEDMSGDDKSRFCLQCDKHVYNFSSMTADAVAALILEKEGKLCGRFYRRNDGTMLTADCPVGIERYFGRLKKLAATVAILLLTTFSVAAWNARDSSDRRKGKFAEKWDSAVWRVKGWFGLNPRPVVTGIICIPPTPKTNNFVLGQVRAPSTPNTNRFLMGEVAAIPSTNSTQSTKSLKAPKH